MIEVSNKTLAVLFGIFIVISLIGIFFGEEKITGMVAEENETGNVTATVVADIDINATDGTIDFGYVLNTFWNNSENSVPPDNITIESLGNTIADIDYWANQSLFAKRNGSTDVDNIGNANEDESYKIRILDAGGCGNAQITSYENVSIGFGDITDLIEDCNKNDEFTVGIQIYVPLYEPSGAKKSILYFRATEYSG